MNQLELPVLDAIQNLRNPILDQIMVFISSINDIGLVWIFAGIALLFFKKYRKNGWIVLFSLLTGLLIANVLLKNVVQRVRPCDINTAVELLIARPDDWSFPSGHTTSSFAAAAALMYADKKMGIPAYILAAVMAFSRMYLYVHYPTDILGGIVIGTLSAVIVIFIYRKVNWSNIGNKLKRK